jgi:hypothetical protein
MISPRAFRRNEVIFLLLSHPYFKSGMHLPDESYREGRPTEVGIQLPPILYMRAGRERKRAWKIPQSGSEMVGKPTMCAGQSPIDVLGAGRRRGQYKYVVVVLNAMVSTSNSTTVAQAERYSALPNAVDQGEPGVSLTQGSPDLTRPRAASP